MEFFCNVVGVFCDEYNLKIEGVFFCGVFCFKIWNIKCGCGMNSVWLFLS